jgi:hypothetical protein
VIYSLRLVTTIVNLPILGYVTVLGISDYRYYSSKRMNNQYSIVYHALATLMVLLTLISIVFPIVIRVGYSLGLQRDETFRLFQSSIIEVVYPVRDIIEALIISFIVFKISK